LPPIPVGKLTWVATPGPCFHAGLTFARKSVNAYVSPLPSLRYTGMTGESGSFTPGLSLAIAGSFQRLTWPRKMRARICPESLRRFGAPFRWYETSVAASPHGTWTQPLQAVAWSAVRGASLAPKSTVRPVICAIPPPEPIAPYVTVTPVRCA
jgi:hypothetical protein